VSDRPVEPHNASENPEAWAEIAQWESDRADILREALEWYAKVEHYKKDGSIMNPGGQDFIPVLGDFGGYARAALGKENTP